MMAYIPKSVRAKRGAPKYLRSEPVLMLGYQHVYSDVYRCLTQRGTIVHTKQVRWDMEGEIGVFPGVLRDAPTLVHERPTWRKTSSVCQKIRLRGSLPRPPKVRGSNSKHFWRSTFFLLFCCGGSSHTFERTL